MLLPQNNTGVPPGGHPGCSAPGAQPLLRSRQRLASIAPSDCRQRPVDEGCCVDQGEQFLAAVLRAAPEDGVVQPTMKSKRCVDDNVLRVVSTLCAHLLRTHVPLARERLAFNVVRRAVMPVRASMRVPLQVMERRHAVNALPSLTMARMTVVAIVDDVKRLTARVDPV